MPDGPEKPRGNLDKHIDELESLLDRRPDRAGSSEKVPVLDELVEEALAENAGADMEMPDSSPLEERLVRRLDAELRDLSQVLREVVRRCVREELGTGDAPGDPKDGKPEKK